MNRVRAFAKRAAGMVIDAGAILAWAALLAVISLSAGLEVSGWPRWGLYLQAVLTLTVPVVLAASALEARFGWTPGKVVTGLRVAGSGEPRPRFGAALIRNAIKYLPWELAHIGIWLTPGQPFVSPPGQASILAWGASYSILGVQLLLVALTGRGLHDRIARTRVMSCFT